MNYVLTRPHEGTPLISVDLDLKSRQSVCFNKFMLHFYTLYKQWILDSSFSFTILSLWTFRWAHFVKCKDSLTIMVNRKLIRHHSYFGHLCNNLTHCITFGNLHGFMTMTLIDSRLCQGEIGRVWHTYSGVK